MIMTTLKTTNIKGKEYVQVNERIRYFRQNYEGYALVTKIIEVNDQTALIQGQVIDKEGRIVATGTAYERVNAPGSMVNKTSHVENCETSAWGRALTVCGPPCGSRAMSPTLSVSEIASGVSNRHAPAVTI